MTGRFAVLSDVHGNLHALRAALEVVQAAGVDDCLHLGDAVGYGPHPNECVDLLEQVAPVRVSGNHEQIVLGRLSDDACTRTARTSLDWTRTELGVRQREVVATWPLHAELAGVVLAHGSPERVDEYVRSEQRARQLLAQLGEADGAARVLLVGHTHEAWAFSARHGTLLRRRAGSVSLEAGDRLLLNPGSVGQSRDSRAHARFLVLDLGAGLAEFHSLPYDASGCRRDLQARGLPADWCHIAPRRRERLRAAAGRAIRRALR